MKYTHLILFAVFLLLPISALNAYETTDQAAVQVTSTSAIYLIEFEFGHGDHDIHIPVRAHDSTERSRDFLSYRFVNDDDERIENVRSAGIVLSDTPIEDGNYVIPEGERRTLTLLVVASAEDISTTPMSAHVTSLPFSFDGEEELQLNPSELQYYRTPAVVMPIKVNLGRVEFSISE